MVSFRLVIVERGINAVPVSEMVFPLYDDALSEAVNLIIGAQRITGVLIYTSDGRGYFVGRTEAALRFGARPS